jgi:hypothetical protein
MYLMLRQWILVRGIILDRDGEDFVERLEMSFGYSGLRMWIVDLLV